VSIGAWVILGLLPVLLALCTANSAAETALFGLTYHDRQRLKRESPKSAALAERLLARPRELLVSLLFINMMVSTLFFVLTSLLLIEATERDLEWLGVLISVVNLLLMTVVAEVVSKMLAAKRRVEFTRALVRPTLLAVAALGPVRTFLDSAVIAPLARLVSPPREQASASDAVGAGASGGTLTEGELAALVEVGAREGAIDSGERRVLEEVIRFGTLRVREVMTPRVDVVWFDETVSVAEIRAAAERERFTRVPICRGSIDDEVLGLLDVKGYLTSAARGRAPKVADHLAPAVYVPERAALDKGLAHLRNQGAKLALCVDEHGAVTGVVSMRDVVERLVSELRAEPEAGGDEHVQMVGLGQWVVSGRLPAREWAEMFGLKPDRRVTTVAGLVLARLGRLPAVGESVRLGNVRLTVEALEGRIIDRVRVSLVEDRA
jgi:putative hemolysin